MTDKKAPPASQEPTLTVAANSVSVNTVKSSVIFPAKPTTLSPKKPTFWDDYKPPALSLFLAFMTNLY